MTEVLDIVKGLFDSIAPYAGLAALVAFVVQLAKDRAGLKDGDAGKLSAALNLVAGFDFSSADAVLGEVASVGAAIVALFGQVGGSKAFYLLGKWAGVFQSKSE